MAMTTARIRLICSNVRRKRRFAIAHRSSANDFGVSLIAFPTRLVTPLPVNDLQFFVLKLVDGGLLNRL